MNETSLTKDPRKIWPSLIYMKHERSNYTVLNGGKATVSCAVPYRANWFKGFNGLLSQIKNLMLTLLTQPTSSENHPYAIARETREPQRNTNGFDEATSNWHILLKCINFIENGGCCSQISALCER